MCIEILPTKPITSKERIAEFEKEYKKPYNRYVQTSDCESMKMKFCSSNHR